MNRLLNLSSRAKTSIEVTTTGVLSLLCSLIVFGPNLKDVNVPWSGGDMTATYINGETWNWWHYAVDSHYGFPYGMNLNYFPGLDLTQNTFAQIVTLITGQPFIGINLLLILSFPIVAIMTYSAVRIMGLRGPLAVALAVAFTFIPWHWGRALGHFYLATLYGAVAGAILALLIASGRLQLWLTCEDKRRRRWYIALIALLLVLAAWSAVYYAFFTGMMLAAALLWRVAQGDRVRRLLLGAIPVVSLAILAIIGLLPSILARASNPEVVNLGQRDPMDTVKYGGDLAISVLPAPYNSLLSGYNTLIGTMFAEAPGEEQNLLTNYGTWITSTCLIVFIVGLVLYTRRRALNTWTPVDSTPRPTVTFVGFLLMLMVLVFGPWSLNFLIANFLITQIRDWNRLLPLMLLLFILGAAATIAGANWTRNHIVTFGIAAVIVLITIVDSIIPWKGLYDDVARGGRSIVDHGATYAAAVNKAIPEHCGIFQLPIMIYPENGIAEPNLNDYDHFLVGLTNKEKDFSYGAMRDTSASTWQLDYTGGVTGFQIQELKDKGFCAVHLDTRGFQQPEVVENELKSLFGKPVATGLDGRWQLYEIK